MPPSSPAPGPNRHGVTNNATGLLPISEHDLTEARSGFDSSSLQAEAVWVTIARAGRKAVALSAACSYPVAKFVDQIKAAGGDPKNFVEFSGFETTWEPGRMMKAAPAEAVNLGGRPFRFRAFDDPNDATTGFDSVEITSGSDRDVLKPREANAKFEGWSKPFKVQKDGSTAIETFRLWSLDPQTGAMNLYQRKLSAVFGTESPETIEKYMTAYGGFHDDEFGAYERGLFGKTLWKGGDGTAENRILEIVRQDASFCKRGFLYGWKTFKPDVLFHYTPMTDSAGHTLMQFMDPDTATDEDLKRKIWDFYTQIYQIEDDWLGFIMDSVDRNTIVALMSDHGMAGISQNVNINAILEKAGLCVFDAKGQVDWSRTKAAVPGWSDFFVVVNDARHKNGIVAEAEKALIVSQVKQALLSATDGGRPLITATFDPDNAQSLGIGGENGGDLYFELAPGLNPRSRANAPLLSSTDPGSGNHGFFPYRRKMSAIFYAAGGDLPKGMQLPVIRHIDIMPTLCKAIGVPAPKDATGVPYSQ